VSGFQILKLELLLTLKGFLERSRVVAAIYGSFDILSTGGPDSYVLPREIIAQYATIAKLFGYLLTPRPADAVELASDAMSYGINAVESGKWYRFPPTEDNLGGLGLNRVRRAVSNTLTILNDPGSALIIVTAGDEAFDTSPGFGNTPLTPLSSPKWRREPISGALLLLEDMLQFRSKVEQAVLTSTVNKEELLPPVFNPFIPTSLRPLRRINYNIPSSLWNNQSPLNQVYTYDNIDIDDAWIVLKGKKMFPLPRAPPETNCQCAFVVQLLSPRPATANVEEATNAELWKTTLEIAATDLAELGAPGGLAYEIRFNKYGMRISFLGLSQTLPSYARRLTRLLVKHSSNLLKGRNEIPETVRNTVLSNAKRSPGLPPSRLRVITTTLEKSTNDDVANEGIDFLHSCQGAMCFSEGDLTPRESADLCSDLRNIFSAYINKVELKLSFIPTINDLLDTPSWKPRNASPCYVAGASLMSDACGRVPR